MLLLVHIIGAVVTFAGGLFSRKVLRFGVLFEVVTGTVLAISESSSVRNYCLKMGLYLAFWLAFEGLFAIRISRQTSRRALLEEKAD